MKVYTDGSCLGNPGPGGWACVFEDGMKLGGCETNTTNNRMELTAVIRALEKNNHITVVTDSQYVKQGVEKWIIKWKQNGWITSTGSGVKNQDLWMRLDELKQGMTIEWNWVKGHAGHPENERADFLANQGVESI